MSTKAINRTFWIRIAVVFMVVMMIFATLPIQAAHSATLGFSAPSIYSNSTLVNAGNAYVSDDVYVQTNGNNKSAVYGNFGFNIPAGSAINLVEVRVEGHGNKNWKVAVSKNNGVNYSAYTTITNAVNDSLTVTGGPGTLWGLAGWTADSLSNANFKVKITSAGGSSSNIAYLDQLTVRVTYTSASATPTTLVITPPTAGTYGGTVTLQATLTSGGVPLADKTIVFGLDGFPKSPSATTDANGVATLSGVNLTTGLSGTLLNAGSYVVDASFSGDSTYAFSSDTDTQVVNPLGITVTADPQSKVYGANDPILTYSSTPALIGTDAFSGALGRSTGENVGTYGINQGNLALSPNYAITYVGASLSITPLTITVTADDKAMHTGNLDPSFTFTFSVSQFVGSDTFITNPTCDVSGSHTTAGTYPIVCSGGNAGSNYTINYTDGTLTVSDKIILTVAADSKTITYGNADPSFTFAYSGFVDGDTSSVIDTPPTCAVVGPHANAGSYPAIICAGGLDDKYEFSYTSGTLTVNPLAVTVTANPQSKTYGATDPVLTYSLLPSLVSGDTSSGTLSRSAGENVGVYAITQGTLALGSNYTVTYVGANLSISKAALAVTADDQAKLLGALDPLFTFQYDGFVNSEDASVIDTLPACGVLVAHNAVGTYPIVCTGGLDNNYSFSYANATLSVTFPTQTFADVPVSHPYFLDIEILYANGYTGGCSSSPLLFCPDVIMDRAQAAVFMLRGNFGSSYVPVTPTHFYGDNWSGAAWAEGWAESMFLEGLTGGCSLTSLMFCPYDQLTNVQAAVFALRMKYGTSYAPPAASGTVFADLTNAGFWGTGWAEQAYADGLIPACGASGGKPLFCPDNLVSRGFGASVIVKAKNLSMP
jgi:hypothetical protein